MTFEIAAGGRVRAVSVEPLGVGGAASGRFRVTVRDTVTETAVTVHEVDVQATDLGMMFTYYRDRRSVDAAVTPRSGGVYLVDLPRVSIEVVIDGRRFRRDAESDDGASGAQRVTAPMPGRIVRVLVAPGDAVAARQDLVVVEAMKMENALASARAGRVREVLVSEGMSVEAGRLLVTIDPIDEPPPDAV